MLILACIVRLLPPAFLGGLILTYQRYYGSCSGGSEHFWDKLPSGSCDWRPGSFKVRNQGRGSPAKGTSALEVYLCPGRLLKGFANRRVAYTSGNYGNYGNAVESV
jgi:hypothetical protein